MRTAERPQTATVAIAVFALLVVATVAAFFVTQRLKRSTPVVRHVMLPRYISPNGDGRKDRAVIKFRLPKSDDRVTVSMTDANGDEVRRLADRRLGKGRHRFVWNGRDSSATVIVSPASCASRDAGSCQRIRASATCPPSAPARSRTVYSAVTLCPGPTSPPSTWSLRNAEFGSARSSYPMSRYPATVRASNRTCT